MPFIQKVCVLLKTRLIFPLINGPNCFVGVDLGKAFEIHRSLQGNNFFAAVVLKASRNELQEILYVACSDPT